MNRRDLNYYANIGMDAIGSVAEIILWVLCLPLVILGWIIHHWPRVER